MQRVAPLQAFGTTTGYGRISLAESPDSLMLTKVQLKAIVMALEEVLG